MTVNVSKPAFNIREKLSELDKPTGIKGTELMRSETSQEVRDLIGSGRKNIIINGSMNIHQRGGTSTGEGYVLDRWHIWSNPTGKHTVSQDTETPVGFKYSMKWTSASAYTPSSGNYFYTGQKIEGHNWDKLEYGTANAKTITISFWARSSITGTWSGIVKNNAQDRTYPWEYTISSADTWEYKTVTVPGCTDGTWLSGVNAGAWIYFCIGSTTSGTTYLGSANSWQNSNLIGTTGSNSLVNTNGATLYITGVQVEVGSYATPFEHRSYGKQLEECQRYYQIMNEGPNKYVCNGGFFGTTTIVGFQPLRTTMRTTPSLWQTTGTSYYRFYEGGTNHGFNQINSTSAPSKYGAGIVVDENVTGTNRAMGLFYCLNASAKLAMEAEL